MGIFSSGEAMILLGLGFMIGGAIGFMVRGGSKALKIENQRLEDRLASVGDYQVKYNAAQKLVGGLMDEAKARNTAYNALQAKHERTVKREADAASTSQELISKLTEQAKEANAKMAGYNVFRGSDARMRALKAVAPSKSYNVCVKVVNKALDEYEAGMKAGKVNGAGPFKGWANLPKRITLKK